MCYRRVRRGSFCLEGAVGFDGLLVETLAIPVRIASALSNVDETSMPRLLIENSRSEGSLAFSRSFSTEMRR